MSTPAYYPYRSAAARDSYFAYYDALAAKDWPVTSETRMVPTTYGETFVRISGPAGAPPLALLPGATGTSLLWAPNIRELSQECRTFAVDQVGDIGRSTCTRRIRSVNDLMVWLDELFNGLELRDGINLMGVSYGGWITAEYARHAPRRLSAAIAIAPGGAVLRIAAAFWSRIALAAIRPQRYLKPFVCWMFRDLVEKDPAWLEPSLEHMRITMRSVIRRLPMPPKWSDEQWAALSVPTLFLVGEHETIYDPTKAVGRLQHVAPQVTTEIIPGAGHDLTMVQAEMVNQKILEFVKQHAGAPECTPGGSQPRESAA